MAGGLQPGCKLSTRQLSTRMDTESEDYVQYSRRATFGYGVVQSDSVERVCRPRPGAAPAPSGQVMAFKSLTVAAVGPRVYADLKVKLVPVWSPNSVVLP